jgi:hypothetical protein
MNDQEKVELKQKFVHLLREKWATTELSYCKRKTFSTIFMGFAFELYEAEDNNSL